jgi:hypothetical protein
MIVLNDVGEGIGVDWSSERVTRVEFSSARLVMSRSVEMLAEAVSDQRIT